MPTTSIDHSATTRGDMVVDEKYSRLYEKQKAITKANIDRAKERLRHFEARLAAISPDDRRFGAATVSVAIAKGALRRLELVQEFLRPSSAEDIEYRRKILKELPECIAEGFPNDSPLRFHGTSLAATRDILATGELSSSVDRLGYATSYDVDGQVSVSSVTSVDVTVGGYTDLFVDNCCTPVGCIFVVEATDQSDLANPGTLLMGNVNFAEEPDRLHAVLTADDNVDQVREWAVSSGVDPDKVMEFFAFTEQHKDESSV